MTLNQLFCPCLSTLALIVLLYLLSLIWGLCQAAARADKTMKKKNK